MTSSWLDEAENGPGDLKSQGGGRTEREIDRPIRAAAIWTLNRSVRGKRGNWKPSICWSIDLRLFGGRELWAVTETTGWLLSP